MSNKCVMTSDPDSHLCKGMESALAPQYGPGLWLYRLTSFKTGHTRLAGIVYTRTKSRKEQPILLNFCPFCGAQLLDDDAKPFHDQKEPSA